MHVTFAAAPFLALAIGDAKVRCLRGIDTEGLCSVEHH